MSNPDVARLTPERRAEIKRMARDPTWDELALYIHDLLAELAAVEAERDAALQQRQQIADLARVIVRMLDYGTPDIALRMQLSSVLRHLIELCEARGGSDGLD